jgi:hypothetical protein
MMVDSLEEMKTIKAGGKGLSMVFYTHHSSPERCALPYNPHRIPERGRLRIRNVHTDHIGPFDFSGRNSHLVVFWGSLFGALSCANFV